MRFLVIITDRIRYWSFITVEGSTVGVPALA